MNTTEQMAIYSLRSMLTVIQSQFCYNTEQLWTGKN